ncbi:hypothetical protein [Rhizobium leguminosarum]|uniref:hypothetical protein n=1 Tax=Rhizobium leguminosarum TaxID=384 RepID=UPI001C97169C|nr:hypothetical protein [Rhizobium leguminosarum]MBY5585061.1 hypothetical protein [Rhizobium leguminosarum]
MSEKKPAWTDADSEAMFATIGRYIVIFQWIEGKLDEILLLGWGHENWEPSQVKLAKMTNSEKVKALRAIVSDSEEFARARTRSDWMAVFERLIERLHAERERRNSLAHSQYLFEFAAAGEPPLRSLRQRGSDGAGFSQEWFSNSAQEKMMAELSQLALDVNFTHVQLVHDYTAGVRSGKR